MPSKEIIMRTLLREEKAIHREDPPCVGAGTHGVRPPTRSAHWPGLCKGSQAVRCPVPGCGQVLPDIESFALHKDQAHSDLRCPAQGCSLRFKSKAALDDHINRRHGAHPMALKNESFFKKQMAPKEEEKVFKPWQANNISFEMGTTLMQSQMIPKEHQTVRR